MEPKSPSSYFRAASSSQRRTTSQLVSIRFPEELLQRLAEVGNEEGLSLSDTVRLVLERGLAHTERKKRT
ncbi:MAG: hypothetical protein ACYCTI_01675 [Acidimicrobiales bacterium]